VSFNILVVDDSAVMRAMIIRTLRLSGVPVGDVLEAANGVEASVSFHGAARGRVVVAVADTLLPAIAANMLGADAAPEPQLQQDALGEVANVLCGTLLPAIAGPAAVFRLDAPRALDPADAAHPGPGETLAGAARLTLDEGDAVALLFAHQPPAAAPATESAAP
jgi:CheY-specific phosphatase CheX